MPKPPGRSFQLRPRGRSSSRLVLLVLATVVLFALVGVRNRLSAGRDVYVDSELRWDNQSHEEGDTPIIGAQVGSMNKTITNDQQKVQRATATTSSVRLNLPGRDYTTAMSVKEVQKIDPRSYIRTASNDAIRQQQAKLKAYLESDEYKTKREKQREYPRRGIIINTGGPELLLSAVVLLRVLRHDLNCTLPVTLAWDGDHEMSAETLKKLKADFAPLDGFNLQKLPYPEHHKRADIKGFVGKAYALLHAPYQQVLLLDTDNMPLKDPTLLFDDPDFIASGNMFWPDFWANWINKEIFDIIGLDGPKAMAVLDQGKGSVRRDAESGQILLDLTRHHDVVEMAFLLNSFHDVVYEKIWGDKDTFQLSFALRGKAHEYRQMEVPPGVIFGWRDGELFVKATEDRKAGYQLMGCLQFNRLAEPIFMHRTINKFKKEAWRVWPIDIVTGPVPYRWAHYYIALDSLGPTKGVDYHYVAPREAFEIWSFNPDTRRMKAVELSKRHGHRKWELEPPRACPTDRYFTYRHLREIGLPLGPSEELDRACSEVYLQSLGPSAYEAYLSGGFVEHPELMNLDPEWLDLVVKDGQGQEVPNSYPIAAWSIQYKEPVINTTFTKGVRSIYDHYDWVLSHMAEYPSIQE